MITAAIIAEYNPFHNGHAYQIAETRRLTGADYIIAVMSGDFVQRGAPAILDKFTRTKMALLGGVDLVIELPVLSALSSAEGFAVGGISLIDALSCVDYLSFGSECGDLAALTLTAALLAEDTKEVSAENEIMRSNQHYPEYLREFLRSGLSYPAARQRAFAAAYPEKPELEAILESPNNILALEYLLALKRLNSTVQPITIPRAGAGYHEKTLDTGVYPSASAIRTELEREKRTDAAFSGIFAIPAPCREALYHGLQKGIVLPDDLTPFLYYRLLDITRDELLAIPDVSPELASRILNLKNHTQPLSSYAAELKTRQYTRTRIDRILMRILLKIDKLISPAPYARILGFHKSAAPLLKRLHASSQIPVIERLTNAEEVLGLNKNTADTARKAFRQSLYASSLYRMIQEQKSGVALPNEYENGLISV